MEALQYYVRITYVNAVGESVTQTERSTLKDIQAQATGSLIVRDHRSFLVNREAIISIAGNAQGLLLTLSDCEQRVPMSRTYMEVFCGGRGASS